MVGLYGTISMYASLAQLVEQLIYTEKVAGSSPAGCTEQSDGYPE